MWTLLAMGIALAADPEAIALPDGEATAPWREPLALNGLRLATANDRSPTTVRRIDAATWEVAGERADGSAFRVSVPIPAGPVDRERIATLVVSLLRPGPSLTVGLLPPPARPPGTTAPPAVPTRVRPPQVLPPEEALVFVPLDLPEAPPPPAPVLPFEVPPVPLDDALPSWPSSRAAPWVRVTPWAALHSATRATVSGEVALGLRAGLVRIAATATARAPTPLTGVAASPTGSTPQTWALGPGALGLVCIDPSTCLGLSAGSAHQTWTDGDVLVGSAWMPWIAADLALAASSGPWTLGPSARLGRDLVPVQVSVDGVEVGALDPMWFEAGLALSVQGHGNHSAR